MSFSKCAALALCLATGAASAEGLYVVGEVTRSSDSLNRDHFDRSITSAGAAGLSSSAREGSNQWRLQGGYRFGENWAVEAGYMDLGKAKYSAAYTGGTANGSLEAAGFDAAGLYLLPLASGFTLFGKAGIVIAKVKSNLAGVPGEGAGSIDASSTSVKPLLGLGFTYALTEHIDLRSEFDHVGRIGSSNRTGTMNASMFSVGAVYHF
ncbi:hypothetical protein BH11PSE8_BH11PSE8_27810 [soil metagenome]